MNRRRIMWVPEMAWELPARYVPEENRRPSLLPGAL